MKTEALTAHEQGRREDNAQKARELADKEFPGEGWIAVEDGIYLSPRRPIGEKTNYKDELRDARILRDNGSTVYLVPEVRSDMHKKYDAIVDGMKMEFKNTGSTSHLTLEDHFYKARTQALNIFINLETSPLSKQEVISMLYGARNSDKFEKKDKFDGGNGAVILKIRGSEKLILMTTDRLKIKNRARCVRYRGGGENVAIP